MVCQVHEIAAGTHLHHDVTGTEHARGNGLCAGIARAHQHRRALGKARLRCGRGRNSARNIGGIAHLGQLVRPAIQAAVLFIHGVVC